LPPLIATRSGAPGMLNNMSLDIRPWYSQGEESAAEHQWERREDLSQSENGLVEASRARARISARARASASARASRLARARAEILHEEVAENEENEASMHNAEATAAEAREQVSENLRSLALVGLMATGAGIMIVGNGTAALVVGATALAGGSVTLVASWDGIACHASVKEGRTPSAIELSAARAVIMVEKGPGRCFYFAYGSREEAMNDLDASFAKLTSRILFIYQNGSLQEVCTKGAPFALNTIRKAAKSFERVMQFSEQEDS